LVGRAFTAPRAGAARRALLAAVRTVLAPRGAERAAAAAGLACGFASGLGAGVGLAAVSCADSAAGSALDLSASAVLSGLAAA